MWLQYVCDVSWNHCMDNIYFNMLLLLFDNKFFLCVYFFFLCGYPHRKIVFSLGERNFSVRVRPTEKLFLTANRQKNLIFLSFYFCWLFSDGTLSEKYFSVGICIFLWIFAHTKVFEIPVVVVSCGLLTMCIYWLVFRVCLGVRIKVYSHKVLS